MYYFFFFLLVSHKNLYICTGFQIDPIWEEEKRALSSAKLPPPRHPVGWPEFRRRPALDRSVAAGDTVVFSVDVAGHNNIIIFYLDDDGSCKLSYKYQSQAIQRQKSFG